MEGVKGLIGGGSERGLIGGGSEGGIDWWRE